MKLYLSVAAVSCLVPSRSWLEMRVINSNHPAFARRMSLRPRWLLTFRQVFDPLETELRARARSFIEELIRGELDAVLARPTLRAKRGDWKQKRVLQATATAVGSGR